MGTARAIRYLLFGALLLSPIVAVDARGAGPTFAVNPASGPRGSSYEVAASGPGNTCPSPSNVVIVAFVDASGVETESQPIPVQGDGSWQALLTVPGNATPGTAHLEAGCHASAMADEPDMVYSPGAFTVTG